MVDKEKNMSVTEPAGDKAEVADKKDEKAREKEAKIKRRARRSGYIVAIIFSVIMLFVFNNLVSWGVPFLTYSFVACLWAINLSLAISIVGNALLLAYDSRWFRHIIQIVLDIFSLIAVCTVYVVFPFAFPLAIWALLAKFILIIIIVAIVVAIIVEIVKLVLNRD